MKLTIYIKMLGWTVEVGMFDMEMPMHIDILSGEIPHWIMREYQGSSIVLGEIQ